MVTIGIPTFNRATSLRRALQTALDQTYPVIEVLVSDNASTDGTGDLVTELARSHDRLRYLRQAENVGAVANFWTLVDAARGEYFVWLADDDWFDPTYVEACVGTIESDPSAVLVSGDATYYRDGAPYVVEPVTPLVHRSPGARILAYYASVSRNGVFYGLTRTDTLRRLTRRDAVAADWSHVADLASLGTVRRAPAAVHRSAIGASSAIVRRSGKFASPIARQTFRQVVDAPGLRAAPYGYRVAVALAAAALIWSRTAPGVLFSVVVSRIAAWLRGRLSDVSYRRLGDGYRRLQDRGRSLRRSLVGSGDRVPSGRSANGSARSRQSSGR
jgi:glycosyltransferase involved in cell wall biosynthesis